MTTCHSPTMIYTYYDNSSLDSTNHLKNSRKHEKNFKIREYKNSLTINFVRKTIARQYIIC